MKSTLIAAHLLVALTASAQAVADATLIYDEGGRQNMLRVAAGKVRFDNPADGHWMLFDGARRELTVVNPAAREYQVLDEATVESLAATAGSMMQMMEAQLAAMPPEMRAQMQQMMGGAFPAAGGAPKVKVQATGRHGAAAGFDCEYSSIQVEGRAPSEVCLAPASELGLSGADQAAVTAWQEFAQSLADKARSLISVDAAVFGSDGQVPLIYSYSDTRGELTKVASTPVPPVMMTVPAEFRRQELPRMMQ